MCGIKITNMKSHLEQAVITAVGYVTRGQCGAVSRQVHSVCSDPRDACRILEVKGVFQGQSKNWGRFDAISLTTYGSALWACLDAGFVFGQGKRRIGIIASGEQGALEANKAFFTDYVTAGRAGARSHLFIYTLPTTPAAEVALFCGFTGPLWYMDQPSDRAGRLIEEAMLYAAQDDVEAMLAVCAGPDEAICFVLQKSPHKALFPASFVRDNIKGEHSMTGILQALGVPFKNKDDR
jgi:hypothetical protein